MYNIFYITKQILKILKQYLDYNQKTKTKKCQPQEIQIVTCN